MKAELRSRFARGAKAAMLAAGFYRRRLNRKSFPGAAVLCYHSVFDESSAVGSMAFRDLHVNVSALDAHCRVLRTHCDPIRLQDLIDFRTGARRPPARPVLVTFDDAYRSVYTLALPILQAHGIPAVVFASTEPVETRTYYWFDAASFTHGDAGVEPWKSLPYEVLKRQSAAITTKVVSGHPNEPMTIEEIVDLSRVPGFEIGAHTSTHPILARAGDIEQEQELAESRALLQRWTGARIRALAYPNGRRRLDYTAKTVQLARRIGYECAFTTEPGFARWDQDGMEQSRFVMTNGVSGSELAHRLAFTWR
jgi:peptidoglycan/xylan/chitin deacetylase (PgdA/CDA1 family)